MAEISILYLDEPVKFDQKQIRQLFNLLGSKEAQDVLATAMRELSSRLTRAEDLFKAANWEDLSTAVSGLEAIGEQIGMRSLTVASRSVNDALERRDTAAVSATFFRLLRVGDRSLSDYRLLCDTSG